MYINNPNLIMDTILLSIIKMLFIQTKFTENNIIQFDRLDNCFELIAIHLSNAINVNNKRQFY